MVGQRKNAIPVPSRVKRFYGHPVFCSLTTQNHIKILDMPPLCYHLCYYKANWFRTPSSIEGCQLILRQPYTTASFSFRYLDTNTELICHLYLRGKLRAFTHDYTFLEGLLSPPIKSLFCEAPNVISKHMGKSWPWHPTCLSGIVWSFYPYLINILTTDWWIQNCKDKAENIETKHMRSQNKILLNIVQDTTPWLASPIVYTLSFPPLGEDWHSFCLDQSWMDTPN